MVAQDSHAPRERPAADTRRRHGLAMVLAFLCVSALLSYWVLSHRVAPDRPHLGRWGLVDFRDAIYYPVVAFLDGNNPYDAPAYTRAYPVGCVFPAYSPFALVLYAPFGLLKFETGALSFLLLNLALTPVLALLALRCCGLAPTAGQTFLLATIVLASRGGYVNLFLGQSTTYLVLASYTALYFARTRPWLAGVGLALCTLKPTFGGPLFVLLLAGGAVRPAVIGLAVALAGTAVPAAILAYNAGGVLPLLGAIAATHRSFEADAAINAASSPLRIDTPALVHRLFGAPNAAAPELAVTVAILGLGAYGVRRLAARDDDASRQLSDSLVCLTTLACVYHQVYGLLLLTLPFASLATGKWIPSAGALRTLRWPLLALLGLPMANYLMSTTALEYLGITEALRITNGWLLALASVNGGALLLAFLLCLALALRGATPAHNTMERASASPTIVADQAELLAPGLRSAGRFSGFPQ